MTNRQRSKNIKLEKRENELLERDSDNFLFNYNEEQASSELRHLNRVARELGVKI